MSFALAVIAIVLRAAPALACPVCLGANGQRVLYTYFATAAVMTLTALGLVGGIAFWLYRRFKQAEMQLSEAES